MSPGGTGREYDAETGLNYHRRRYYEPDTGHWLSEDPIHARRTTPTSTARLATTSPVQASTFACSECSATDFINFTRSIGLVA
jgi:RHS repeat-associated protein